MYFTVRFPDAGAGRTRMHCYLEGESEAAVRELALDHPHFQGWDPSKGSVTQTDLEDRTALETRLADVTNPNTAVLADGTVLRRSREAQEIIEQRPE